MPLTNARGHAALQWLLDYAPANLYIALVSRGAIPISIGRLRDQGQLLELDMRDLRFTNAESETFLRVHLGEISARDARRLHELADGWAAGLQLFAMRLKRQRASAADAGPDSPFQHLHDPRAFTEFFVSGAKCYRAFLRRKWSCLCGWRLARRCAWRWSAASSPPPMCWSCGQTRAGQSLHRSGGA